MHNERVIRRSNPFRFPCESFAQDEHAEGLIEAGTDAHTNEREETRRSQILCHSLKRRGMHWAWKVR